MTSSMTVDSAVVYCPQLARPAVAGGQEMMTRSKRGAAA